LNTFVLLGSLPVAGAALRACAVETEPLDCNAGMAANAARQTQTWRAHLGTVIIVVD